VACVSYAGDYLAYVSMSEAGAVKVNCVNKRDIDATLYNCKKREGAAMISRVQRRKDYRAEVQMDGINGVT